MPYIITTKVAAGSAKFYPPPIASVPTSRTAVATLDEAIRKCRAILSDHGVWPTADVDTLPEASGTIGPLPDGTVIEVRPVSWAQLRGDKFDVLGSLDQPSREARVSILEAFNAA